MSPVPALKVIESQESELERADDVLPGSLLARIGGARRPRGLSTLKQVRREQACVYLAAKRGDIAPEAATKLTYVLREIAKSIEAESGPLEAIDAEPAAPPESSRARSLVRELFGSTQQVNASADVTRARALVQELARGVPLEGPAGAADGARMG